MTTQSSSYDDIQEGKPRIVAYDENGIRTTTTTARHGIDPNEKPKETVTVRTIQHPDSTETVTVTEKKLPPIRYTETITREKLPKKNKPSRVQAAPTTFLTVPSSDVIRSSSTSLPVTPVSDNYIINGNPPSAKTVSSN